jgi:hypothetical protein
MRSSQPVKRGKPLSRHSHDFVAADAVGLDFETLFQVDDRTGEKQRARHAAMACFLSQGDGWRDAKGALAGAFATLAKEDPRLRSAKEE